MIREGKSISQPTRVHSHSEVMNCIGLQTMCQIHVVGTTFTPTQQEFERQVCLTSHETFETSQLCMFLSFDSFGLKCGNNLNYLEVKWHDVLSFTLDYLLAPRVEYESVLV